MKFVKASCTYLSQAMSPSLRKTGTVLIIAWALSSSALAQDVLIFNNGDRLTGTIQRIQRGVVAFLAPNIDGEVKIGWERIDRVDSERSFLVRTTNGVRLVGKISTPDEPEGSDEILIVQPQTSIRLHVDEVAYIAQTVGRLEGLFETELGGGFTLAKSNKHKQFNVNLRVSYETTGFSTDGGFDSFFSTQENATNTNRQNLWGSFTKNLSPKWGGYIYTDILTSEQQKLDRRLVIGGGPLREILRTVRFDLNAFGGAVWNNEVFSPDSGQTPVNNQIEGALGVNFSVFEFKQLAFDSNWLLFPSFSEQGRVRMDWRNRLRFRLFRGADLWWNFRFNVNLDSQPPAQTPGSDYVTTTSLSWEFP